MPRSRINGNFIDKTFSIVANTVQIRPELENSKINAKKILKIKKHHPGFISRRNGFAQAEK